MGGSTRSPASASRSRPAKAFGLVGANGAGKTTLVKCALDLCAFDSGAVEIFGASARRPGSRRRLAYVPERFVPPHYLMGREFLEMMLTLAGARFDGERAARLLEELELERDVLERPVRRLSEGNDAKGRPRGLLASRARSLPAR